MQVAAAVGAATSVVGHLRVPVLLGRPVCHQPACVVQLPQICQADPLKRRPRLRLRPDYELISHILLVIQPGILGHATPDIEAIICPAVRTEFSAEARLFEAGSPVDRFEGDVLAGPAAHDLAEGGWPSVHLCWFQQYKVLTENINSKMYYQCSREPKY